MMKKVCVFGSYRMPDEEYGGMVLRLGRRLAKKDMAVVTGGFGGLMELVSRGAKEAGGATVGVTYRKKTGDSKRPNPYVDKEIKTYTLFERISVMAEISDAFVVLKGGTGTLLELAAILEFINKGIMPRKPVVALGEFWYAVKDLLCREPIASHSLQRVGGITMCSDLIHYASTEDDVLCAITDAGKKKRDGRGDDIRG